MVRCEEHTRTDALLLRDLNYIWPEASKKGLKTMLAYTPRKNFRATLFFRLRLNLLRKPNAVLRQRKAAFFRRALRHDAYLRAIPIAPKQT